MIKTLYFDSMEQRIVMSAGIAPSGANLPAQAEVSIRSEHSVGASVEAPKPRLAAAAARAHPVIIVEAKPGGPIKGSFKGGQSELLEGGSLVSMTGSRGKIGNVAFAETAEGEVSGNSFLGGTLNLTNSQGTMTFTLEPGTLKQSGKDEDLKVIFIIDAASGTYVPTEGSSGNVTIKLGAAKPGAKSVIQERLLQWNADWLGLSIIMDSYPDTIFYYFCLECR
jgi:hypothetical protein